VKYSINVGLLNLVIDGDSRVTTAIGAKALTVRKMNINGKAFAIGG